MLLLLAACSSAPPPLDAAAGPRGASTGLAATERKLTLSNATADDQLGAALGHGDFNGDGHDDVIAGASWKDSSDLVDENQGAAVVWYGATGGLGGEQPVLGADSAEWDYYGMAVGGVGDVDGDGYDDAMVGAYADDDRGSATGAAWFYPGSAAGLVVEAGSKLLASDTTVGDFFGSSVTGVGDVDGDGYPDVVVGALGDDDHGNESGAAYVLHGGPSGLDVAGATKLTASDGSTWAYFGWGVAGGDFDGDGYADVAVGAYGDAGNQGAIYLYYGGPAGIRASTERKVTASDGLAGAFYGLALAGAGDLDGDGRDDLVVGAPYQGGSGAAYVYFGATNGLEREIVLTPGDGDAAGYGWSVGGGGDLDDDGFPDVVVGAHLTDRETGRVYVYRGDGAGVGGEMALSPSDGSPRGWYGYTVSLTGDTNGDGIADLAVGTPQDRERGTDAGAVYAYTGTCSDHDGDGRCGPDDCDDADAAVYVGAPEVCGGVDDDCDGLVDDDDPDLDESTTTPAWADADRDGHGDPDADASACAPGAGTAATADDCDDTRSDVHPGATEVCDVADTDEDCDGLADDADDSVDPAGQVTAWTDADGDEWGAEPVTACDLPSGTAGVDGDCDDADPAVSPGASDQPDDGIDQDCDGVDSQVAKDEIAGCGCATGDARPEMVGLLGVALLAWSRRRRAADRDIHTPVPTEG